MHWRVRNITFVILYIILYCYFLYLIKPMFQLTIRSSHIKIYYNVIIYFCFNDSNNLSTSKNANYHSWCYEYRFTCWKYHLNPLQFVDSIKIYYSWTYYATDVLDQITVATFVLIVTNGNKFWKPTIMYQYFKFLFWKQPQQRQ